ncbi:hypothetical protein L6R52_11810 [Myxococcota bacterium]|nr:hypothetical protein [Myxococcota bacterium]
MLVFGDPRHARSLRASAAELASRARLGVDPLRGALDALTEWLVLAGQLEQGVADAGERLPPIVHAWAPAITDELARAFVREVARDEDIELYLSLGTGHAVAASVAEAVRALDELASFPGALEDVLEVKVPEGFAYHGLHPEQYVHAARVVAHEVEGTRERGVVVVVGLRTIGTTLSAVVTAELRRLGVASERTTVRPIGHPSSRDVPALERAELVPPRGQGRVLRALVVDEGPGLSGSSMVAVARLLVRRGVDRRVIRFLPGHAGGPGPRASRVVRTWWAKTPRVVAPPPTESVLRRIAEHVSTRSGEVIVDVEDLSGGLWRRAVYASKARWPAVAVEHERPKYRLTSSRGRRWLAKLFGYPWTTPRVITAVERALEEVRDVAELGYGPRPIGAWEGWLVVPWIDGEPLEATEWSDVVQGRVADYLSKRTGRLLFGADLFGALEHLRRLLVVNAESLVGPRIAAYLDALASAPLDEAAHGRGLVRRYADGHVAPHEWIRALDGSIVKVDVTGHDTDHTGIGVLPEIWDLAAVIVEWALGPDRAGAFLADWEGRSGRRADPGLLEIAIAAYTATRAAQATVALEGWARGDEEERARLARDRARYLSVLERVPEARAASRKRWAS